MVRGVIGVQVCAEERKLYVLMGLVGVGKSTDESGGSENILHLLIRFLINKSLRVSLGEFRGYLFINHDKEINYNGS